MDTVPRMWGFQAAGAAPLVAGHPIDDPETVATAIRIGNPASWTWRIARRDESGGRIDAVTDEQILDAHRELARLEGVFCEPSSAASVAGVAKAAARASSTRDALVVCVLTGNGLKDPTTAEAGLTVEVVEAEPTVPTSGGRSAGGDAVAGRAAGTASSGAGVTVEVPASSANLGAGYDCLGLALELANRVAVEAVDGDGSIELAVTGEGDGELPASRENRFVAGLEAALEAALGPRPASIGWRIAMDNAIPLSRGLGSSAAATVGGVVAGADSRAGRRRLPRRRALLQIATTIESHPDNAAAVLLGGFVVSAHLGDRVEAVRFDAPDGLRASCSSPSAGSRRRTCDGSCRPRSRCATP